MNGVSGWGMIVFLVNEATLFGGLIASYFYVGVSNRAWPPPGVAKPALAFPLGMTALLLSSSVALVVGERALERGQRGQYRGYTLLTVILGAAFLLMQAREYHDKLRVLGPTDNAYGSLFYTITGLHGTHVAFGLLVLLWTLMRDVRGTIAAPQARSPAIRNASLYWHFVDGVWIAVFTTLYLTPRWS